MTGVGGVTTRVEARTIAAVRETTDVPDGTTELPEATTEVQGVRTEAERVRPSVEGVSSDVDGMTMDAEGAMQAGPSVHQPSRSCTAQGGESDR